MLQPPRLYHCMNRTPEGDAMMPTCEREVNGRTDKFLFATPYVSKAMAFCFDYHDKGEIICNGSIDGTQDEFAIICNRDVTLNAPRHIQLFAFPGEGFEPAFNAQSRQFVSTQPVPFDHADCLLISHDVEDTMLYGLQIFSTDKTLDQLFDADFLDGMRDKPSQAAWLNALVKEENFVWENQARNLNPNQKLQNAFDDLDRKPAVMVRPAGPSPQI